MISITWLEGRLTVVLKSYVVAFVLRSVCDLMRSGVVFVAVSRWFSLHDGSCMRCMAVLQVPTVLDCDYWHGSVA